MEKKSSSNYAEGFPLITAEPNAAKYWPADWRKAPWKELPAPDSGGIFNPLHDVIEYYGAQAWQGPTVGSVAQHGENLHKVIEEDFIKGCTRQSDFLEALSKEGVQRGDHTDEELRAAMKTSTPVHDKTRTSKAVGECTKAAPPDPEKMVPCSKSEWHGFHKSSEPCGYCAPPPKDPEVVEVDISHLVFPFRTFVVDCRDGQVWDARHPRPNVPPMYELWLESVKSDTVEAKRICGCSTGAPCKLYKQKGTKWIIRLHEMPKMIKDPKFEEKA